MTRSSTGTGAPARKGTTPPCCVVCSAGTGAGPGADACCPRLSTSYKDNLKNMGSFNTLEGFWRYYVHLKRPSTLQRDVNLYIFRKGCAPMWEVSLSPCPHRVQAPMWAGTDVCTWGQVPNHVYRVWCAPPRNSRMAAAGS